MSLDDFSEYPAHRLRYFLRRFKERARNALLPDDRRTAKLMILKIEQELQNPARKIQDEEPPF